MKRLALGVVAVASLVLSGSLAAQRPAPAPARQASAGSAAYFPERFGWEHKRPEEVGMDSNLVNQAVQAAIAADTPGPHDMTLFLKNSFGKEPFDTIFGPVKDRGPASGII